MENNKIIIIAEAGVNHNGSLDIAKTLAVAAKKAGADAVKYQTFRPESLVSQYADKADYQKRLTGEDQTQLEMIKKLALSFDDFIDLKKHCDTTKIQFLSTPFDHESIDFLNDMVRLWKIPSGEITNTPYLIKIAQTKKPVILSTGMSDLPEIEFAVNLLKENGAEEITLLHCNTEYPTPFEDANLRAICTLKEKFGLLVGYSDHTMGSEAAIAAAALGASVIEKHFTLDKNSDGPDHMSSLEPEELSLMIRAIRNIEKALGNGMKKPSLSESKNRNVARKSIVAKRSIKAGERFTEENITVKRPGNGISPTRWFEVLGQTADRYYSEDELIEL